MATVDSPLWRRQVLSAEGMTKSYHTFEPLSTERFALPQKHELRLGLHPDRRNQESGLSMLVGADRSRGVTENLQAQYEHG
jgi:hypothetical protein